MYKITQSLLAAALFSLASSSFAQVGVGTTIPVSDLSVFGNTAIGTTYSVTNVAPTNGLRVEGQTVIGKPSGEDTRDVFSAHTSTTSFNNVTGYGGDTAERAISGYADGDGIGVFGFATRTGYGVVGLSHANTISAFVQQGEGVLGQADGRTGATSIPIGVHGIIDEPTAGVGFATPVMGENNNITTGAGIGGSYNFSGGGAYQGSVSGVYGNIGTTVSPSNTNAYQFGVVGDILLLGVANAPDASGGIVGLNASGDYGILGYKSENGTLYSGYFANSGNISTTGTDGRFANNQINGRIGIGVVGGFMGGYVRGNQYGILAKGREFGMYVEGNTVTSKPIIQLVETNNNNRVKAYSNISTSVDVNSRGKGKLNNGQTYISFSENFRAMIANNEINITITPTGNTNGVYVTNVTKNGFYVKENLNGNSNASFNWIAIGTRKGFENGVEISDTILSKSFDDKMNSVMSSDGNNQEGSPIHYNGNDISFERMPEGTVNYRQKTQPKRK